MYFYIIIAFFMLILIYTLLLKEVLQFILFIYDLNRRGGGKI